MEINLLPLDQNKSIDIDTTCNFTNFEGTDIQKMTEVKVTGTITKDVADDYFISLNIQGTMTLPDSLTLEPVEYPFDINVDENLEEVAENFKKSDKTIDILPIIWENILMEIPMRVVSEGAEEVHLEGDGWKLVTDKDSAKETNPALAKLKDLL